MITKASVLRPSNGRDAEIAVAGLLSSWQSKNSPIGERRRLTQGRSKQQ
jgi:hypothetical protein